MDEKKYAILGEIVTIRATIGLVTDAEKIRVLVNSINYDHVAVIKDQFESPAGYISWAKINEESLKRFLNNSLYPEYFYEWNEGDIVMITDIAAVHRYRFQTLSKLRDLVRTFNCYTYKKGDRAPRLRNIREEYCENEISGKHS